jgi:hypothetical protein
MAKQQKYFNLVRKHRGDMSIFQRNLTEDVAFKQLKHWKAQARNAGGRVYFELVEVPYELTPEGLARAQKASIVATAA